MSLSVLLLKALPATLTNSNCFFILVDIPSKKHASSSRIYSLNVAPRHQPIFWICVSEYPARESAFTPPLLRECVSSLAIGISFFVGYSRADPVHLVALLTSSLVTTARFPPSSSQNRKRLVLNYLSKLKNTTWAISLSVNLQFSKYWHLRKTTL